MKVYKSSSIIAINVRLDSGKYKHISFDSTTTGSELFVEDEALQKAIERHPNYNKMFTAETMVKQEPVKIEEEVESSVVHVNDETEAKEYLADKFGISRTKLKTMSQIKKAAKKNGIEFSIE